MKKLLLGLCGLVFSVQLASAGIIAKANTWQMMGYGMDVNLSATITPSADQFSLIWYYDDGDWKAFSKDPALLATINNLGIYGDNLKAGQAFWVKAKKDFSLIPYIKELDILPKTEEWHLISLGSSLSLHRFDLFENGSQMFVYREGKWDYAYKNNLGELVTSKELLFANANEGFWLYKPTAEDTNSTIYNQTRFSSSDTLSNKTFSYDSTTLTLDQNGIVLSNDAKYNGGKWSGNYFDDWGVSFRIVKDSKKYNFNFDRAYDSSYYFPLDYYNLSYVEDITFQTLSNGVVENLDSNSSNFYNQNVVMNVIDYDRPKVLDPTVKTALDALKSIIDFGDTDPRAKLNTIKTNLQSLSNDNDAKVILALVNLIEILDEDIVKNTFLINNAPLDLNNILIHLFPQDTNDMGDLASGIANYSTNAKSIMQSLSARLKANADVLKTVQEDENFYLPYDGASINFADVKVLRGIMLGLAFKLQYLSSYTLGSNEWFDLQNDRDIEFQKVDYDPVGFLNSGSFFVSPDATELAKAKVLFREFIAEYYELLDAEYYQREGMVVSGDKFKERNLKRHLKLVLNNIDGLSSKAVYVEDSTDWNTQTLKQDIIAFDFNALFNPATAITISDFPLFEYNGVLDVEKSRIESSPVDANWVPLDFNPTATTFDAGNKINSFVKYFVDQDGVTFSSASLLNEIFNQ